MRITSSRCCTFLTNMLPSAAKPLTAKTARSVLEEGFRRRSAEIMKKNHEQAEHFGCIARLDTVSFTLPGVTCNDREIRTGDGEDGAAVLCVRVELASLGLGVGTVGHCVFWWAGVVSVGDGRGEERKRGREQRYK
jgi:hypothetical protein